MVVSNRKTSTNLKTDSAGTSLLWSAAYNTPSVMDNASPNDPAMRLDTPFAIRGSNLVLTLFKIEDVYHRAET